MSQKPVRSNYFNYIIIFCVFRTVAFALRSKWSTDLSSVNIDIASLASLAGGFFIIVSFAFDILFEWMAEIKSYLSDFFLDETRLARIQSLIRTGIPVFSVIGVIGGVNEGFAKSLSDYNSAIQLRKVSSYGFLACSCLFLLLSVALSLHMLKTKERVSRRNPQEMAHLLLSFAIPVGSCLVIRTSYTTASFSLSPHNPILSDKGFYPLEVMPEVLLVMYILATNFIPRFVALMTPRPVNCLESMCPKLFDLLKKFNMEPKGYMPTNTTQQQAQSVGPAQQPAAMDRDIQLTNMTEV